MILLLVLLLRLLLLLLLLLGKVMVCTPHVAHQAA